MNSTRLTIGRLAAGAAVSVETVRYYQRIGLMPVPRREHGTVRSYSQSDLERLRFIRRAQELDFTLEEVRRLLKLADEKHCAETCELAQQKLDSVRAKLKDLIALEHLLDDLVNRCHTNTRTRGCPIIECLGRA